MDVRELNRDQLEQLKHKVYYMNIEELEEDFKDVLTDEIVIELEKASIWLDISDNTIYTLFSGIDFVEEDF